jgi:hypothetical protein
VLKVQKIVIKRAETLKIRFFGFSDQSVLPASGSTKSPFLPALGREY